MARFFELKIPPDVVWLAAAALCWVASLLSPGVRLDMQLRIAVSGALVAGGVALIVAARIRLSRAHTTWRPTEPERTSALVTDGVYRVSRNPVYLGMAVILIGWAVWLASPLALAVTALFVVYLDRFQIRPEERVLAATMGDQYRRYAARVRRWV